MTEEKPKKETRHKATKNAKTVQVSDSVVFIGQKPVMNYVLACLTCFNSNSQKIVVKARGRAISRAVDTVELLRRSFSKNLQLEGISISTEEVTRIEGQKANVSSIEITLVKS